MNAKRFNQIGLILCILGTSIIFKWGLPQPTFTQGTLLAVSDNTRIDNTGKTAKEHGLEVEKKEKFYSCMSKLGMAFIIIGFIFQFLATTRFIKPMNK
jgi:hypothetical protein